MSYWPRSHEAKCRVCGPRYQNRLACARPVCLLRAQQRRRCNPSCPEHRELCASGRCSPFRRRGLAMPADPRGGAEARNRQRVRSSCANEPRRGRRRTAARPLSTRKHYSRSEVTRAEQQLYTIRWRGRLRHGYATRNSRPP